MDRKAEVKNAFISADTTVADQKAIFMSLLKDSSNNVVENALEKLMLNKSISAKDKMAALKATEGMSGQNNNIRTKWLEYAISNNYGDKQKHLDELSRLCGANYEFRTRVNAAQSLKRLNVCDKIIAANLIDACLTYNGRLSGPCAEVLCSLKKDSNFNAMIQTLVNELNPELQETLKKLGVKD
jgi:hypothetical protein